MDFGLDYELVDFGNGRKLERFGDVLLDRPEVLAVDSPALSKNKWETLAHWRYMNLDGAKGNWMPAAEMPIEWKCGLNLGNKQLQIQLSLGDFKHVGVFPEQDAHWRSFAKSVKPRDKFLNLFAYTGVASIIAASHGADVYHVDSSRSILKVAKANAEMNGISNIHWVAEDALKFAQREVQRGHKYDWILLDPPIFGRGLKGEIWKLETLLPALLAACANVLSNQGRIVLNTYSPKLSLSEQNRAAQAAGFRIEQEGFLKIETRENRFLEMSRFLTGRLKKEA